MAQRKSISDKVRLETLKRDNFTCTSCGKSPALFPELQIDAVRLEIDHINPHSKWGSDNLDNLQTLCMQCNRGKWNHESLNITIIDKINILLDNINPKIIEAISSEGGARVVANEGDFSELMRLCELADFYKIEIDSCFYGFGAGLSQGIYTIRDNGASKVNFIITINI